MKKALVVLVIIGIVGGAVAVTYMNRPEKAENGLVSEVVVSRYPVKTLVATPETLVEKLESTGVLQAKKDVTVTAEVGGKIVKMTKELGDECDKDEILARIDPESYRIAVSQARAALMQAQISAEHAGKDMKRFKRLKESAVVTEQQFDSAEGAEKISEATVAQARAALQMASRNLRETTVRCPFSGNVAEKMTQENQVVAPHAPIARLADLGRLKLVLSVTSAQLARLTVGQQVELVDPSIPDKKHLGTVSNIGVAADEATKTFPVEIAVQGDESGLRIGQVVQASLEIATHKDVIALPEETVRVDHGSAGVFKVSGQKAEQVDVALGPRIGGKLIIRSGLKPGDRVVTLGVEDLRDGAEIEVVDQAAEE